MAAATGSTTGSTTGGTTGGATVRLDCLGSANAFGRGRYWSGFLFGGRVLLDCPPQALVHLFRLGVPTAQIDLVLLSHEHTDHTLGLDPFLLEAMNGTSPRSSERPLAIAGPPGIYARMREIVGTSPRLPPRDDPRTVWFEQPGGSEFEWEGVRVECVEVEHAPAITALGFRIHLGGRVLAYSGDTRLCDALYALAEGADLLITEGGGESDHHHMTWDDVFALRRALPPATRMLVTHYPEPRELPDLAGLALAEDFATYEV